MDYLRKHISIMEKTVEPDGFDLLGYLPWGPIDLVSAGTGQMDKHSWNVHVWIILTGIKSDPIHWVKSWLIFKRGTCKKAKH